MRMPTMEQAAVLDSTARVRVVRAAPGSGKTWLVAELIHRELERWPTKTSGIAAVSFTRVGGEEIRKAMGQDLSHPHFVGTIDAFLFRYVVRPFFQQCYPGHAAPRLIPGEWSAETWGSYGRGQASTFGKGINLFSCVFIDEDRDGPILGYRNPHGGQLILLDKFDRRRCLEEKWRRWKSNGMMTHSDVAYLSSIILRSLDKGRLIQSEISRRFPLFIVDELQDTGLYLGRSLIVLLLDSGVRGVLVGDPDQAIYEFNGAKPELFAHFEALDGAACVPLVSTQRCPEAVAAVATLLKADATPIEPCAHRAGRAILVRYEHMVPDIRRLALGLSAAKPGVSVKIIARQTSVVLDLRGQAHKLGVPRLGCPALAHMQRAVVRFREGRQGSALAAARAAIELALFGYEGVDGSELELAGIESSQWRYLAVRCLLSAADVGFTGSLLTWQTEVGKLLWAELDRFGMNLSSRISPSKMQPKRIGEWDKVAAVYFPAIETEGQANGGVPVSTVHSVKGETHDVTVFVCPRPARIGDCPSAAWWPGNESGHRDHESRRIAYVAMTRTRGDLIVCVANPTFERLSTRRKQFVSQFECLTVEAFLNELGQNGDLFTASRCLSTSNATGAAPAIA